MVVGVLGLICGLCGALDTAMIVAGPKAPGQDLQAYLNREAPAWIPIASARAIILFLLSCLVLVAGVGLFQRQSWARWMAVAYAAIGIPMHLIYGIYGIAVYMPAMERFVTNTQPGAKTPGFSNGFTVGFLITFAPPLVIWLAGSIFLLIAMLSPPGAAAFRSRERRRRYEDDDELGDDYDDRPRRRRRDDDDYE